MRYFLFHSVRYKASYAQNSIVNPSKRWLLLRAYLRKVVLEPATSTNRSSASVRFECATFHFEILLDKQNKTKQNAGFVTIRLTKSRFGGLRLVQIDQARQCGSIALLFISFRSLQGEISHDKQI
jgi:hypothetical protein